MRQATVTERATAARGTADPRRRRPPVWMIALPALLLVAAAGGAWWAFSGDGEPDPAAPTGSQSPTGGADGELRWQATVAPGTAPALVADDFVITGHDTRDLTDDHALVRRFDRVTGAEVWTTEIDSPVSRPIGTADDVVIVVGDGSVSGLDLAEGVVLWQLVAGEVPGSPVALVPVQVEDEHVLVGGETLTAVDPRTGTPVWDVAVDVDRLTVDGDLAVVAGDGQVHAVDREAGTLRWTHDLENGAPFATPPLVFGGDVVAASRLGDVVVLERDDGRLRYHVLLDELGVVAERTDPAEPDVDAVEEGRQGARDESRLDRAVSLHADPGDGVIVVGGETGTLYAFSHDDGERQWDRVVSADLATTGSLAVHTEQDLVVVGGPGSQEVAAFRLDDGLQEWSFRLTGEGDADVPPFVTRDHVFAVAASVDGRDLVALVADDGAERFRVGLAQEVTAPLLAGEATVFAVARPADPEEASVLYAVG